MAVKMAGEHLERSRFPLTVLTGWEDQYLESSTDEYGAFYNFDPSVLGNGFKEITFEAWSYERNPLVKSEVFTIRATRFIAPEWLLDIKVFNTGIQITQKPEYTEAKFSVELPANTFFMSLGEDGVPIIDKIDIPDWELKVDFVIRSNGEGKFEAKASLDVDAIDSGKIEAEASVFIFTEGTLQIPWYGEGTYHGWYFWRRIGR